MQRLQFHIRGRVQGVAYRANTQRKATELGLTGFVQNQSDGSVYAEAQGTADQLQAFTEWCQQGPAMARVEEVTTEEISVQDGESDFRVKW